MKNIIGKTLKNNMYYVGLHPSGKGHLLAELAPRGETTWGEAMNKYGGKMPTLTELAVLSAYYMCLKNWKQFDVGYFWSIAGSKDTGVAWATCFEKRVESDFNVNNELCNVWLVQTVADQELEELL